MSLTDWVKGETKLVDALFDKPAFNIKGGLKAEPLTKNYPTVGTAFDYALRLQVASLNANLVSSFPLVAQKGVGGNRKRREFINNFEEKRKNYLSGQLAIHDLLQDCVILAKMDNVFRSGKDYPNSDIFSVDEADIEDLQRLINLVDPNLWIASKQCFLNPDFGQSSLDLNGADADLIIDSRLIDIKTTKYLKFKREDFRQLVGYQILNIRENDMYGSIESLGLYFSRFGILFIFPTPEMHEIVINGDPVDKWQAIEESIREYQRFLFNFKPL